MQQLQLVHQALPRLVVHVQRHNLERQDAAGGRVHHLVHDAAAAFAEHLELPEVGESNVRLVSRGAAVGARSEGASSSHAARTCETTAGSGAASGAGAAAPAAAAPASAPRSMRSPKRVSALSSLHRQYDVGAGQLGRSRTEALEPCGAPTRAASRRAAHDAQLGGRALRHTRRHVKRRGLAAGHGVGEDDWPIALSHSLTTSLPEYPTTPRPLARRYRAMCARRHAL